MSEKSPLIPASHNRLAEEIIYCWLVKRPAQASFARIWLKIEGPLPHPADGPVIAYVNHTSWWDGYMALIMHREVFRRRFENYLMMDERQLQRYRFFSWIGVFSVSLTNARDALRSVNYIAALLRQRRDRFLWIFPQGTILPNDTRPLQMYPGLAQIARRAGGATMWPVALRYEFRGEERPEIFIRAGPAHYVAAQQDVATTTGDAQTRLTAAVDALRDEVLVNDLAGYQVLIDGRPGINQRFDAFLAAIRRRPASE